MGKIEQLAQRFEDHISLPWQQHLAAPEKTIFIIYPKEEERRLRAKQDLFQQAVSRHGHGWHSLNLDNIFAEWMAEQDYAEDYFEFPEDLQQKLDKEFTQHVTLVVKTALESASSDDVVGVFGIGALFGFAHISNILKDLEGAVKGRLVLFFPGSYDKNVFRLLDAHDGWGYMALPITLNEVAYT